MLTGAIGNPPDNFPPEDFDPEDEIDPERITACAYWRCEELFEMRTANHQFCRKACRSRQHKWERAQERKVRKAEARANRAVRQG